MSGWIKLHRKFINWEWFDDPEAMRLFLYLLLSANHKDGKWKGIPVKRGQLITGLHSLSDKLNLSIKVIRNRLDKLEKTGEIGRQAGNQYSVITICNYDIYQYEDAEEGKQMGKQRANGGQAKGKQRATNKNEDNVKNVKEEYIKWSENSKSVIYKGFVKWMFDNNLKRVFELKDQIDEPQFQKVLITANKNTDLIRAKIESMENYKDLIKNNVSFALTLKNWIRKDIKEEPKTTYKPL